MTTPNDPQGHWDYQVTIKRVTAQTVNDRVDELEKRVAALEEKFVSPEQQEIDFPE